MKTESVGCEFPRTGGQQRKKESNVADTEVREALLPNLKSREILTPFLRSSFHNSRPQTVQSGVIQFVELTLVILLFAIEFIPRAFVDERNFRS